MQRIRWTDRTGRQKAGVLRPQEPKEMSDIGYTAVMDDDGIPYWLAPETVIEECE